MTPQELDYLLKSHGVSPGVYYIEGTHDDFLDDNSYFLVREKDEWVLGYAERGRRDVHASFENFDGAAELLIRNFITSGRLPAGAMDEMQRLLERDDVSSATARHSEQDKDGR